MQNRRTFLWPLGLALALSGSICASAAAAENDQFAFFEQRVRPILVERCYDCHSGESIESDLRLDSLAGMLTGGERGPAIVPGDAQASLLISAVKHADQLHMPPEEKLPQSEIAALSEWVKNGAPWPNAKPIVPAPKDAPQGPLFNAEQKGFWAFQPIADPPLPEVHNTAWIQSPIDRFILARLEAAGLEPAPPADKHTLIRRMTFDLTGLPPTPDEVAAFLADDSPTAVARLVDRLLASPRYGERWGRHWLDVARYADSNGLDENLAYANAFRYRDYVIAALNRDKPFDRFIEEQIAGDLLPSASEQERLEALVATGFLSLGAKMLAEDDPVKMQMDIIDEQLDTIGRALLGMTLGCARCHDHKFDPIPTEDYYSLAGIFKSTRTMENFKVVARWQERELATADELRAKQELVARIDAQTQQIEELVTTANEQLLAVARQHVGAYLLAAERHRRIDERLKLSQPLGDNPQAADSAAATIIEAEDYARGNCLRDANNYGRDIGVILNKGELPNVAEYDVEFETSGDYQLELRYAAAGARPVKLIINGATVKPDAAAQQTGSWNPDGQQWAIEGIFALPAGRSTIRLERDGPFPHFDKLLLARVDTPTHIEQATAADSPQSSDADSYQPIDALVRQWAAYLNKPDSENSNLFAPWRRFVAGEEFSASGDDPIAAALAEGGPPQSLQELAQRYEQLSAEAEKSLPDNPAFDALRKILHDPKGPFAANDNLEAHYDVAAKAQLAAARKELAALQEALPEFPTAMAVADAEPQNVRVHLRGNHLTLGDEAPRRFLRIIAGENQPPLDDGYSGRLQLAKWLTSQDHPLTSRVIANRLWLWHFGEGLVRSPDNFGRLGQRPTHPELLDWLARRFVESGWSLKEMHRLIMLSSTYQMSTEQDLRAAAVDPDNELWQHRDRRRREAEAVRDALLAVSGEIDFHMGGSSLGVENRKYVTSTANVDPVVYDTLRRSVYLPVVRSALYDVFQAFDFPDPSVLNGRRETTTVAPQALFMMNSQFVLDRSAALSRRLLAAARDDDQRVRDLYQVVLSRAPTDLETERALSYIDRYAAAARDTGAAPNDCQQHAWHSLCKAVLASSEFLYVE